MRVTDAGAPCPRLCVDMGFLSQPCPRKAADMAPGGSLPAHARLFELFEQAGIAARAKDRARNRGEFERLADATPMSRVAPVANEPALPDRLDRRVPCPQLRVDMTKT